MKIILSLSATKEPTMDIKAVYKALVQEKPIFIADLGLVKKLRSIASILSKISESDSLKLVPKALLAISDKYTSIPVAQPSSKEAKALAITILQGSVAKLYKAAITYKPDLSLTATSLEDCAGHLELACAIHSYVNTGRSLDKIQKLISVLDTSAREDLSTKVFDWVSKEEQRIYSSGKDSAESSFQKDTKDAKLINALMPKGSRVQVIRYTFQGMPTSGIFMTGPSGKKSKKVRNLKFELKNDSLSVFQNPNGSLGSLYACLPAAKYQDKKMTTALLTKILTEFGYL